MVVWLVGLSGSGKTTIGRRLYDLWKARESNVVLLDGDAFRRILGEDGTDEAYSLEGRRRNAERIAGLCQLLDSQNIHVVCCILSLFEETRRLNRTRFESYFEIFVDTPLEVLERRDTKGLYAAARAGTMKNVVGVDIEFERPEMPNYIISNGKDLEDPAALANVAFQRMMKSWA